MLIQTPCRRRPPTILVCLLVLTACGGGGGGDGGGPRAPSADDAATRPERHAAATAPAGQRSARLPTADAGVPLADYVELEGAHQLASAYYALGELPPDMDVLARISSTDYAYTTDAFRKQDLLAALEPQLRAQLEHARTNRYLWTDQQGVCLGHYDMATRSFPVSGGPTGDSYLYFGNSSEYKLSFTNGDDYRRLEIADEQRARELEARVTKGTACGRLRLYVYAQGADLTSKAVRAQIVTAQLYDYQRNLVTDL